MNDARRPDGTLTRARDGAPWVPVEAPRTTRDTTVTTRVQSRLSEKARMQRRRRRRTWGIRLSMIVAGVLVVWAAVSSPLFALERSAITVTGYGTVVSRDDVDQVLSAYEGQSLVLLDGGALAADLREVQGVREVEIERVWPRSATISMVSREPVAAVPSGDEAFVLVDEDGVEVETVADRPAELPVISVPVGADNVRVLDAVLTVVGELPAELRERVGGIAAQTEDSVTFTLREGPRVEWGSAEQSALKAEVLRAMLASPEAANADVIDVSAPTLPITRSADD